MSTEVLQVKKLTENAYLPVRGTPYAAGRIKLYMYDFTNFIHGFLFLLLYSY